MTGEAEMVGVMVEEVVVFARRLNHGEGGSRGGDSLAVLLGGHRLGHRVGSVSGCAAA